jgi:hypothetical protein
MPTFIQKYLFSWHLDHHVVWSQFSLPYTIVALFFFATYTCSAISLFPSSQIVLTDVFWFKKKKLPSYQVREEHLVHIWLVKTLNRKRLKGIISENIQS